MKFSFNHSTMTSALALGCFITVDGNGNVSDGETNITVGAGGDVSGAGHLASVSSEGAPRDPGAPPETEEEKAARETKERENETPEQKTEREAREAEETRRAGLTDEQRKAEDDAKAAEAATKEVTEKNEAWEKRDTTKDVAVSPEQEAEITKMGSTPEQQDFLRRATLQTNTINDLTPAMREEAAKLWGVSPEMVDRYVQSVVSQNEAAKGAPAQYDDASEDPAKWSPQMQTAFRERMDALHAVAGGEAQWNEFAEWADQNLTPADRSALEQAIQAAPAVGAAVAKTAIAKWKAAGGGAGPRDLSRGAGTGAKAAEPAVKGFANRSEQNAAISDPRYAKDADYRAMVDQRIILSDFSKGSTEENFFRGASAGTMMV